MSEQFDDVVHLTNIVYQIVHCRFLCRGPGVGRFTVSINATDIADPDAMIIVTDTMCPCDREWPTGFYSSVQIDYIVIANLAAWVAEQWMIIVSIFFIFFIFFYDTVFYYFLQFFALNTNKSFCQTP